MAMTADRLLRCHIRARQTGEYDILTENGVSRLLDMPERNRNWASKGTQSNGKSPIVGGLLSFVIPGAGQWYGGRRTDAVFAFSTIATFAAGTWVAHRNGETGLAWTFGVAGGLLHVGNVYGGINAVRHFNESCGEGSNSALNVELYGFRW